MPGRCKQHVDDRGYIVGRWYLPHSRSIRDDPTRTVSRFPKTLTQMKKLSARAAPLVPNTFSKKTPAATTSELRISSFDAAEKYAMFARTYSVAVRSSATGALHRRVLIGFWSWVRESRHIRVDAETYADFIDNVERVLVARVREHHLDHGICSAIYRRRRRSLECIPEVDGRIGDRGVASEDNKAGDTDANGVLASIHTWIEASYKMSTMSLTTPITLHSRRDHFVLKDSTMQVICQYISIHHAFEQYITDTIPQRCRMRLPPPSVSTE